MYSLFFTVTKIAILLSVPRTLFAGPSGQDTNAQAKFIKHREDRTTLGERLDILAKSLVLNITARRNKPFHTQVRNELKRWVAAADRNYDIKRTTQTEVSLVEEWLKTSAQEFHRKFVKDISDGNLRTHIGLVLNRLEELDLHNTVVVGVDPEQGRMLVAANVVTIKPFEKFQEFQKHPNKEFEEMMKNDVHAYPGLNDEDIPSLHQIINEHMSSLPHPATGESYKILYILQSSDRVRDTLKNLKSLPKNPSALRRQVGRAYHGEVQIFYAWKFLNDEEQRGNPDPDLGPSIVISASKRKCISCYEFLSEVNYLFSCNEQPVYSNVGTTIKSCVPGSTLQSYKDVSPREVDDESIDCSPPEDIYTLPANEIKFPPGTDSNYKTLMKALNADGGLKRLIDNSFQASCPKYIKTDTESSSSS